MTRERELSQELRNAEAKIALQERVAQEQERVILCLRSELAEIKEAHEMASQKVNHLEEARKKFEGERERKVSRLRSVLSGFIQELDALVTSSQDVVSASNMVSAQGLHADQANLAHSIIELARAFACGRLEGLERAGASGEDPLRAIVADTMTVLASSVDGFFPEGLDMPPIWPAPRDRAIDLARQIRREGGKVSVGPLGRLS